MKKPNWDDPDSLRKGMTRWSDAEKRAKGKKPTRVRRRC